MINIIDGFYVGNSKPIDSRIVASSSTMRDSIGYKYDGLKVFNQSDRTTYIWNESTLTWSADVTFVGGGELNYIPLYSAYRGFTISNIAVINNNVGINTTNSKDTLQIDTIIGSSEPFVIHKGNSTMVADNWYYSGGSEHVFSTSVGSSGLKFDNGKFSIINRSANSDASLESATPSMVLDINRIEVRRSTSFNRSDYSSGSSINAFIRSSDGYSLPSTPEYTWSNNITSGIYHPTSNAIGVSTNGIQRLLISSTGQFSFGQINAASKIHIDSGNAVQSYIKFTAGTTTGTSSTSGFDIGISAAGNPTLISRSGSALNVSFSSNGTNAISMDSNEITVYGSGSAGSLYNKSIVGSKYSNVNVILAITYSVSIHTFVIPSSSFVAIEADYVSCASGDYVRHNKIISSYLCQSNGNMVKVGTDNSIRDVYNTDADDYISAGSIATTTNQLTLLQEFNSGLLSSFSGYSQASFKATITLGDFSLPS